MTHPIREANPQRERILRSAARLFAARGYHAVGMAELEKDVQMGRGALYHHIHSKEDLLYDITKGYIAELTADAESVVDKDPRDRVCRLGTDLILKIAACQAELTVCFREVHSLTEPRHSEVMSFHARYEHAWRQAMVDGVDAGEFRPYEPVLLKAILGMYFYSYLWLRPSETLPPAAVADKLNDLALAMLARKVSS